MRWFRRNSGVRQEEDSEEGPYEVGQKLLQQYCILACLGRGGFGTVYLTVSASSGNFYALKVVSRLDHPHAIRFFKREALFWAGMTRHPNVLTASVVEEANGRLLILSEYIAKNSHGVNTLADWCRQPHDLVDILQLGIQVCDGLAHAYSEGLSAHRDIKPTNIMVADGSMAKVADFGIAITKDSDVAFWSEYGPIGTPAYMSPEQYRIPALCDTRSDIFSFGVVLAEIAETMLPSRLDDRLPPIVQKCVAPEPGERYQSVEQLRDDLELLLVETGGGPVAVPKAKAIEVSDWNNRGVSLLNLGRGQQALASFQEALNLAPDHVPALYGKGKALAFLGDLRGALDCFSRTIKLRPDFVDGFIGQAAAHRIMGNLKDARRAMRIALSLKPLDAAAWSVSGNIEASAGNPLQAVKDYDKAIELDAGLADAWYNKGTFLNDLERYREALDCFDRAVELNPLYSNAWDNRGVVLSNLGRKKEAMSSYDRAILTNPENVLALGNKAGLLCGTFPYKRSYFAEAAQLAGAAIELDDGNPGAWYAYGSAHDGLGDDQEAHRGYVTFIRLALPGMEAQVQRANERIGKMSIGSS